MENRAHLMNIILVSNHPLIFLVRNMQKNLSTNNKQTEGAMGLPVMAAWGRPMFSSGQLTAHMIMLKHS